MDRIDIDITIRSNLLELELVTQILECYHRKTCFQISHLKSSFFTHFIYCNAYEIRLILPCKTGNVGDISSFPPGESFESVLQRMSQCMQHPSTTTSHLLHSHNLGLDGRQHKMSGLFHHDQINMTKFDRDGCQQNHVKRNKKPQLSITSPALVLPQRRKPRAATIPTSVQLDISAHKTEAQSNSQTNHHKPIIHPNSQVAGQRFPRTSQHGSQQITTPFPMKITSKKQQRTLGTREIN